MTHLKVIKSELPSLSELTVFDAKNFLREIPRDGQKMREAIKTAATFLRRFESPTKEGVQLLIFLHGYLGNAYRVTGETARAIEHLQKAVEMAEREGEKGEEIRALIRLGEAYKYHGQHETGLRCFAEAEALVESEQFFMYRDFIHQHRGKCLMEMGRLEEALSELHRALRIRENKGDVELIRSTEEAIKLANRLKARMEYRSDEHIP